jgi:hypothetical protein
MTEYWTNEQGRRYFESGETPAARTQTPLEIPRPTPNEVRSEKNLQRLCELELHRRGIRCYMHLSFRAREKVGYPDLTFPLPGTGQFMAVELKSATGKLTREQKDMLANVQDCGGRAYVIRDFMIFVALLNGGTVEQWNGKVSVCHE